MLPVIQFIFFCAVGVASTVIDFGIFNLLTRPGAGRLRLPVIPASILSVTAAMTWSFAANWLLVFRPAGEDWIARAGRFLATTLFSAFVLQNLVLFLTTRVWKGPVRASICMARKFGLHERAGGDWIARNTCKTLAVAAGLVWNFCWYKFYVFAR